VFDLCGGQVPKFKLCPAEQSRANEISISNVQYPRQIFMQFKRNLFNYVYIYIHIFRKIQLIVRFIYGGDYYNILK